MKFSSTVSHTATSTAQMRLIVLHLTTLSCWFEVTPEPDDRYTITVRRDVAHLAFPDKQDKAQTEGWGLFIVDGRYQLQRDDEANMFSSDAQALIYVALKANDGSRFHREALELIGTTAE